jgi:hypothetical protein
VRRIGEPHYLQTSDFLPTTRLRSPTTRRRLRERGANAAMTNERFTSAFSPRTQLVRSLPFVGSRRAELFLVPPPALAVGRVGRSEAEAGVGGDSTIRSAKAAPTRRIVRCAHTMRHPPHKSGRDEDRRCVFSVRNDVTRKQHTHLRLLAARCARVWPVVKRI